MDILERRIDERLNQIFKFKRKRWMGTVRVCVKVQPKRSLYPCCYAKSLQVWRINKCRRYEEHIKDICDDLFKDWSEDFPKTEKNPNASADAYMQHARGFDIAPSKDAIPKSYIVTIEIKALSLQQYVLSLHQKFIGNAL